MRMSDLVAQYIVEMLDRENGSAEIQRNELAGNLGCVPSQINYVITSRFTPEKGYIVESRRGGGGFIRISRVKMDRGTALMHIINSIGTTLDKASAEAMLKNMLQRDMIELTSAKRWVLAHRKNGCPCTDSFVSRLSARSRRFCLQHDLSES